MAPGLSGAACKGADAGRFQALEQSLRNGPGL